MPWCTASLPLTLTGGPFEKGDCSSRPEFAAHRRRVCLQKITEKTELVHQNRVWLGNNYAFRFAFPGHVWMSVRSDSAVQCSAVQCSAVWCSVVWCGVALWRGVPVHSVALPARCAVLYRSVLQCVLLCGVVSALNHVKAQCNTTALHRPALRCITSFHITSRHVTSRHVTSRHVTSRHVTSRHVTPFHGCSYCYCCAGLMLTADFCEVPRYFVPFRPLAVAMGLVSCDSAPRLWPPGLSAILLAFVRVLLSTVLPDCTCWTFCVVDDSIRLLDCHCQCMSQHPGHDL